MEYEVKYDPFKADLFAIAMIILELITLDKPKYYYSEDKSELKMDRIAFDLSSMGQNYSDKFVGLLKGCLQADPHHRLTIAKAYEEIILLRKNMKSVTYCIRLQED